MTEFPTPEPYTPPAPARFSTRAIVFAVALFALLAGAAAGAGGLLLAGFREPVEHAYVVMVYVKSEATNEQTAVIRRQLDQSPHDGEVEHQSSAENLVSAKQAYKDQPYVLEKLTESVVGQSYKVTVTAVTFDCGTLPSLRKLPGVTDMRIAQSGTESEPAAVIMCP
ncbi:permease-like cell division protein FtsX [Actinoplanes sp. CA-131856]